MSQHAVLSSRQWWWYTSAEHFHSEIIPWQTIEQMLCRVYKESEYEAPASMKLMLISLCLVGLFLECQVIRVYSCCQVNIAIKIIVSSKAVEWVQDDKFVWIIATAHTKEFGYFHYSTWLRFTAIKWHSEKQMIC